MKTILITLFSVVAVAAPLTAADEPLTVAVLDFQTTSGPLAGKGSEAALLINASLSASPNVMLVERQDLEKILGEQELGLGGLISPDTIAKIGMLTGAKVLVTGKVFEAGGKQFLVAKIMSTETSRVYGETATFGTPDGLSTATTELAGKIAAVLEKNGSAMVAKEESFEELITRLKTSVAGKQLPSVTVKVEEQHLQRPVIDPAVETELRLGLQQIGFEVIDANSGKVPDIQITGEAFSEFGARRGNLVSCRGRVEIKAVETGGGKLLLTERQTEAGVDIAENIAGKNALQNASRKLLGRIVPKLAN